MKYRINYTYRDNKGAALEEIKHNYHFVEAETEEDALQIFKESFADADRRELKMKIDK